MQIDPASLVLLFSSWDSQYGSPTTFKLLLKVLISDLIMSSVSRLVGMP